MDDHEIPELTIEDVDRLPVVDSAALGVAQCMFTRVDADPDTEEDISKVETFVVIQFRVGDEVNAVRMDRNVAEGIAMSILEVFETDDLAALDAVRREVDGGDGL